jgi:membrane protein DedA with SNARE-associated domain
MIEDFTVDLVEWIEVLPLVSIYLAFFLIAYSENVIPPIPGDLLVVFGGYLAAEGLVNFPLVLFLTTVASVGGFMTMYWLGYTWGDGIREKRSKFWVFKYINFNYTQKAQGWMNRWGQGVIMANRFLAGTRSVISLMSGISQTNIRYTIFSSTFSSLLWNFILLGSGWIIQENWEEIGRYLSLYSRVVIALIAVFVVYKLVGYRKKRKLKSMSEKNLK